MSAQVRVKLNKPIETHKGKLHELVINPLTAGPMMRLGKLPFALIGTGDNARIEIDFKLAGLYLEELTGHDESVLSQMAPLDFSNAIGAVSQMFMTAGASPGNS